jgi:hypothetical protein
MTINTPTYTAVIGAIIGLVWSFALNFSFKSGLIYGGIIGLILGLFLSYIQYSIAKRGNIQKGEIGFVAGSLLGLLIWVGVGTGLIAWLIRAIFF